MNNKRHETSRKWLAALILSAAVWAAQAGEAKTSTATQVVNIPDSGLQATIRAALNKPIGDITIEEMESLTELESIPTNRAAAPAIESFEGLQFAQNLLVLRLEGDHEYSIPIPRGNALATSDLSALSMLPNLRSLLLSRNQLKQPMLPAGLTNLQTLEIFDHALGQLTIPADMLNLQTIKIHGGLTNLSLPAGLSTLQTLEISDYSLSQFTVPADMLELQTLKIHGGLTSLSLPAGLTKLRTLDLSHNIALSTTLALPSGLAALQELRLDRINGDWSSGRLRESILIPADLTNLVTLSLSGNELPNVDFLPELPGLQRLELNRNQLTNLRFLSKVPSLRTLELDGNRFTVIELPEEFPKLRDLTLSGNPLRTFPPGLTHLTRLNLNFCHFTRQSDFGFLRGMHQLKELHLSSNNLGIFTLPEGLSSLETLYIYNAQLMQFTLSSDSKLQTLYLGENKLLRVTVPTPIPTLRELYLSHNPLADFQFLRNLPHLELLNLSGNELRQLSLPPEAKSLKHLDVSFSKINDFSFLEGFSRLEVLNLYNQHLTEISLPEGLTALKELGLRWGRADLSDCVTWGFGIHSQWTGMLEPCFRGPRYIYVGLPASIDLNQLTIHGFVKSDATILGLWMRSPILRSDGSLSLRVNGARGRTVHAQRSTNLRDWETFQTVTLSENGAELTDDAIPATHRFYRLSADAPDRP
jgi:internalin A